MGEQSFQIYHSSMFHSRNDVVLPDLSKDYKTDTTTTVTCSISFVYYAKRLDMYIVVANLPASSALNINFSTTFLLKIRYLSRIAIGCPGVSWG